MAAPPAPSPRPATKIKSKIRLMTEAMATNSRGRLESPMPRRMEHSALYPKMKIQPLLQMTIYFAASSKALSGVFSSRSRLLWRAMDRTPSTMAESMVKENSVPMVFCISSCFFAPTCWDKRIWPPVQKPVQTNVRRSTSRPPVETADSPAEPIKCPTTDISTRL